jgi:hypothetical protein
MTQQKKASFGSLFCFCRWAFRAIASDRAGSDRHLGRWQAGIDLLEKFNVHCMEVKMTR